MIRNYLKVAWRRLNKNKIFSVINILGLSVGLSCCMFIALYILHENSYDTYHPHIDRLYQVGTVDIAHGKETRFYGCPPRLAGLIKGVFAQVERTARICRLIGDDQNLIQYHGDNGDTRSFYEDNGMMADSGFFHLFHYDFVEGNANTAISGPYSVVLEKDIADKLFEGKPAVGKTIHIASHQNGDHDYTVTGVFRPIDKPSHINGRFFLSMYGGNIGNYIGSSTSTMSSNYFFVTYALLRQGADPAQIEKGFPAFVETYEGKDLRQVGDYRKQFLLKVRDIHLHANMPYGDVTPSGSLTYLYILASTAIFILLIACINFMNLSTARSTKQSLEVGVRKTLGAGRASLVGQFLGESLLMAFIALGIALLLTIGLLPAFEKLADRTIHFQVSEVVALGAGFLALTILTGLLAGSYPAFYLSSFKPVKVLKGKTSNSLAVISLRKGLVIFQFCISIVLIVAAVIIGKQMHYLRTTDMGFNKDQQLILSLRGDTRLKYTTVKKEIDRIPGVSSSAGSTQFPGIIAPGDDLLYAEGHPSSDNHHVYINFVDFDYMKMMGLQMVSGHAFSSEFPHDSVDGIILNETVIRELGYDPATCVGKKVYSGVSWSLGAAYRIVGVVKDFHFEDLHNPITGIGFEVFSNPVYNYITVNVNKNNPGTTIAALQHVWQQIFPSVPFEYTFLDERFQKNYEADRRVANIVAYATGFAIFISCLGLFGLAAFSAEQRTKEIGIRKVLGASEGSIVALLSRDFLRLVAIAVLIGSPLGWYLMQQWLQGFAYRTTIGWTVFALTTGTALFIALLTISSQALRAASANPVKSLRAE
ncbi:MAG TPA: ABC transporter permease [Puia sp.]|jgi:putative ABC transport system permease protein